MSDATKDSAIGSDLDGPLLSAVEIADLFNVHPSTIRRLAREGRIPSFRVGTTPRFAAEEVARAFRMGISPRPNAPQADVQSGTRKKPTHPLALAQLRAELFGH